MLMTKHIYSSTSEVISTWNLHSKKRHANKTIKENKKRQEKEAVSGEIAWHGVG